jgi:hypothetical protein
MTAKLTPTVGELLGAFQLGVISANEAREALGFKVKQETEEEGK